MSSAHLLGRLLARHIGVFAEQLPRAVDGDPTGVHQARVASRRLRETLPVTGAGLRRRRVRRLRSRLRRVTRLLGPVREQDVALQMVASLARPGQPSSPLADAVARDVAREREARLALLAHRVDPARVRRVVARLERFAAAIPDPRLDTRWRHVLAERIQVRAHALQVAVADAGALYLPERLHAVRIAVKKLRYALELASEARLAPAATSVRQLREAQDILGELHDHDVLRSRVAGAPDDEDVELADARAEAVAALDAKARALHARYLRRQASIIRAADRALDAIAPRVGASAGRPGSPEQPDAAGTRGGHRR
jgi:CHAD domain-containing protein